jgi:hypothetical protein
LSIALTILEPHGSIIVPPGWQLAADAPATPDTEHPTGSLAEALTRLAARNGMRLIAPPTVEAGGQVRLL